MEMKNNWNYPTTVYFGAGRLKDVSQACKALSITHPLIVSDPFMANQECMQDLQRFLKKEGLNFACFFDVKANPCDDTIASGVKAYNEGKHDSVIAIGGGSSLDAGKTIALMCKQTCPLWELEDKRDNYLRAKSDVIPPIIAIPTTAGTGSEVGRAAVIVDNKDQSKKIIFHPKMLAAIVIDDPCLTLSVPPFLTAATGMDALAHNLEAFLSPSYHPLADGIALEGCRLIKENLLSAFNDGSDLHARTHLMAAATMGATAFQKGLGVIHSLSHPVGAVYNKHHGLLNAIFMPYALAFNRPYIEEKCARLSHYLELPQHGFDGVYAWVTSLNQQLDIPTNLKAIDVGSEKADKIAKLAYADPSSATNPRPLTIENLKALFIEAVS